MTGNIVLCGFMGCGKTTVGKRAARLLGREFCDLDRYIEEKEKLTVSQIFEAYGEEGFRRLETQAAREVSRRGDMVVACGGGTVLFPQNVEALHENGGLIVLLDVPLSVLQERLKNDKKRPLLQRPNRRQVIGDLYRQRIPLYRAAADVTVRGGAPLWVAARRVAALAAPSGSEKA